MKRIALFGGSFDPPHAGHVVAVSWLASCAEVDQVWVMPTFDHAFGKVLTPFATRLELCRLAFAWMGDRVFISDMERQLGGASRTIRLVDRILDLEPGCAIKLVIGSDLVDQIPAWKDSERLLSLVELLVMRRGGHEAATELARGPLMPEVSSSWLRQQLGRGGGVGLEGMLPDAVWQKIAQEGLYGCT